MDDRSSPYQEPRRAEARRADAEDRLVQAQKMARAPRQVGHAMDVEVWARPGGGYHLVQAPRRVDRREVPERTLDLSRAQVQRLVRLLSDDLEAHEGEELL